MFSYKQDKFCVLHLLYLYVTGVSVYVEPWTQTQTPAEGAKDIYWSDDDEDCRQETRNDRQEEGKSGGW